MREPMPPGFYNMDCMEAMKQFPDGFFDLAIVDPPYGINVASHAGGKIVGGVQGCSVERLRRVYGASRRMVGRQNFTTPSTTAHRRVKGIFRNCNGCANAGLSGAGISCLIIWGKRPA